MPPTTMPTVEAIHVAPVKSLGLAHPRMVHVGLTGIVEDRRLYLIGQRGNLLTQREVGQLVQVKAEYRADPERLGLRFPDGSSLEGPLQLGEAVVTPMWGHHVQGHLVEGDWSPALTRFCDQPVRLVRSAEPGQCYDEYPISLMSQGSLQELGRQAGANTPFDSRRFRPNFLIGGDHPHEEDSWLGSVVQIGDELRIRVVARDPRCAITTHDPDTGDPDIDTLSLIIQYRPSLRAAYFGVYGIVERPGMVSLGDEVNPIT